METTHRAYPLFIDHRASTLFLFPVVFIPAILFTRFETRIYSSTSLSFRLCPGRASDYERLNETLFPRRSSLRALNIPLFRNGDT